MTKGYLYYIFRVVLEGGLNCKGSLGFGQTFNAAEWFAADEKSNRTQATVVVHRKQNPKQFSIKA